MQTLNESPLGKDHENLNFNFIKYNLALFIASPLIATYLLQRYLSGKSRQGWTERWGVIPNKLFRKPGSQRRIWIHAVSAGETVAAVPIIKELRKALPNCEILLSVITPAGHEIAAQNQNLLIDGIFFAPFDFPHVVKKVVNTIRPDIFVSMESELWPNLLHELKQSGVKTAMANGRISEKSFQRSSKYAGWLYQWALSNMDRMLVQSEADAERIKALGGILNDPGRVKVIGNSKFDEEVLSLSNSEAADLRRSVGFPEEAPIFIAGSSRSREEESIVIEAYKSMQARFTDLRLIIAPRQIDRAAELEAAMKAAGLEPVRKTQLPKTSNSIVRHLILDTMGELANMYAIATFAFVGNSFDPVVKGGGQNLLQPLAHGKPVLFGPKHATIRSEVALVLEAGIGFQVNDAKELSDEGIRLLENEERCSEISVKAHALISAHRGISKRYAALIAELLNDRSDISLSMKN